MVRGRIWFLLLLLQLVMAGRGSGGGEGDDLSPTSSNSGTPPSSSSPGVTSNTIAAQTSTSTPFSVTPTMFPLVFMAPSNATTCMSATFQWEIVPSSFNLSNTDVRLTITNDGVEQGAPMNSTATLVSSMQDNNRQLPSKIISRNLTDKAALSLGSFDWPAVTVPEGWYILEASEYGDDLSIRSPQFYILMGPNTTCVYPSISPSFTPSSHSQLSPGALAGTVIGAVVGVAALIGAFALPRLWRRGVPGHQAWKHKHGGLYRLF